MVSKTTKINVVDNNLATTKINSTQSYSNKNLIDVVLLDKYKIVSKISTNSGEAELYKCTDDIGNEFVAKVFNREKAIKPEVLEKLKTVRSVNVVKLITNGLLDNRPFVILPYFKNGSLVDALLSKGKTYNLNDIKKLVLPSLNNGLKTLHDAGIIHKDLKPSNIMISDDFKNLVIIDFGVSTDTNGSTVVVTKSGMTPLYLAPEALSNTYLKETDYYALGITLYELYTGHTPYENLSEDQVASYASIQKIPFPQNFPIELKTLIEWLTFKDLSNRNDMNNPNRRWMYPEVEKWLSSNGKFNLAPTITEENTFKFYDGNRKFSSIEELVETLLKDPEHGKKLFARGELSKKLRQNNQIDLASMVEFAEGSMPKDGNESDMDKYFLRLMYSIAPKYHKLCWKKIRFNSLHDYGCALIDDFNNYDHLKNFELIDSATTFLENDFLLIYLKNNVDIERYDLYEEIIKNNKILLKDKPLNYKFQALRLGRSITGKTNFLIGEKEFKSVDEFVTFLNDLYNNDIQKYASFSYKYSNDINDLKEILVSNDIEKINSAIPSTENLLVLNNRKYYFRGINDLSKYVDNLLKRGELKHVYNFDRLTRKDIYSYRDSESNSTIKNKLTNYLIKVDSIIYIDDEHIYGNINELMNYANTIFDSGNVVEFIKFCKVAKDILSKRDFVEQNNSFFDIFNEKINGLLIFDEEHTFNGLESFADFINKKLFSDCVLKTNLNITDEIIKKWFNQLKGYLTSNPNPYNCICNRNGGLFEKFTSLIVSQFKDPYDYQKLIDLFNNSSLKNNFPRPFEAYKNMLLVKMQDLAYYSLNSRIVEPKEFTFIIDILAKNGIQNKDFFKLVVIKQFKLYKLKGDDNLFDDDEKFIKSINSNVWFFKQGFIRNNKYFKKYLSCIDAPYISNAFYKESNLTKEVSNALWVMLGILGIFGVIALIFNFFKYIIIGFVILVVLSMIFGKK